MEPMFLPSVENNREARGSYADLIQMVRAANGPIAQIWHLFAFKPDVTQHLERFAQGVMRGPSPLSPGTRELIAAYTSVRNECPF